ncbi:MAG: hypothetical protein AAGA80_00735 [Cyanobacteria bacterium P01_F01_bin.143]
MTLSNSFKSISLVTGGLLLSYVGFTNPAIAFSVTFNNSGFEDSIDFNDGNGWEGTGDTLRDSGNIFTQIAPITGSSQALITTGRHTETDDPNTTASTFNYSDINPVTATSDDGADELQDFLGLSTGALSINRSNSDDDTKLRTAKEGSGIYQDFTVTIDQSDIDDGTNAFYLSFNWAYLTNEPTDSRLGDQDFAFFTVFDTDTNNTPVANRSITVLDDSNDDSFTTPLDSGLTDFQETNTSSYSNNSLYTYTSEPITTPGTYTYRVGFGVVDVDGLDRSSGLLLDNFQVQEVPFEFSPTAGIALMLGLLGCDRLRRRMRSR